MDETIPHKNFKFLRQGSYEITGGRPDPPLVSDSEGLTIHWIFCLPAFLCDELSQRETKMSIFADF